MKNVKFTHFATGEEISMKRWLKFSLLMKLCPWFGKEIMEYSWHLGQLYPELEVISLHRQGESRRPIQPDDPDAPPF